jgi:hypothetical protein
MARGRARCGALAVALSLWLTAPSGAGAAPSTWLPAEDERRSAEERALEQALAGALSVHPGVERTRVLVRLPRPAERALDLALPPAEVAVWVEERGVGLPDAAVASALEAAGLAACRWHVTRRAKAVAPPTETGAEPLARSWLLRVVLAVSLAANVVLATATLLGWPKGRRGLPARSKES